MVQYLAQWALSEKTNKNIIIVTILKAGEDQDPTRNTSGTS